MKKIFKPFAFIAVILGFSMSLMAADIPFSLSEDLSIEQVKEKLSNRVGFEFNSERSKADRLKFNIKNFDIDGVSFGSIWVEFYEDKLMKITFFGSGSSLVKLDQTDQQIKNLITLKTFYLQQGEKLVDDDLSSAKTYKDFLQDRFLIIFDKGSCQVKIGTLKAEFGGIWTSPIVEYSVKKVNAKYEEQQEREAMEKKEKSKSLLK